MRRGTSFTGDELDTGYKGETRQSKVRSHSKISDERDNYEEIKGGNY